MTVDPDSPDLLFEQLAEVLRQQLADGTIPPRHKMPTQEVLSEQYGVSRGTVLKATNLLTEEGLIRWVKGRGLFSSDKEIIERFKRVKEPEALASPERFAADRADHDAEVSLALVHPQPARRVARADERHRVPRVAVALT